MHQQRSSEWRTRWGRGNRAIGADRWRFAVALLGLGLVSACGGRLRDGSSSDEPLGGAGPDESGGGTAASGGTSFGASGGGGAFGGSGLGGTSGGTGGRGSSTGGDPSSSTGGTEGSSGGSGGGLNLTACLPGSYDSDLTDDVLSCVPWSICQPGTYLGIPGSYDRDRVCNPCPEGSYTSRTGAIRCDPFSKCDLAERVRVEPTSSSDTECEPSTVFPPQSVSYGSPLSSLPLLLHDGSAYFLTGPYYGNGSGYDELVRYSLDGTEADVFHLDVFAQDWARVGDHFFIVGVTIAVSDDEQLAWRSGRLTKHTLAGTQVSMEVLSEASNDQFLQLKTAARDGLVYVAARVEESECEWYDPGLSCSSSNAPQSLRLMVYDTEDEEWELTATLQDESDIRSLSDMSVATGGHVYVSATVDKPIPPELCTEDLPYYYYYNCLYGAPIGHEVVFEFDQTGAFVAEHTLGYRNQVEIVRSIADESDGVFLLTRSFNPETYLENSLHHVGSDGAVLLDSALDFDKKVRIDAISLAGNELLFLGKSDDGPTLVRTDLVGEQTSFHTLTQYTTHDELHGVAQSSSGSVFINGSGNHGVFVYRWPQP